MLSAFQSGGNRQRCFSGILLAVFWGAGLLFGASAASLSEHCIHSLMQQLSLKPLSIVGLLIQILFSVFLTVLAVILSKPKLFYLTALIRAFFLSYYLVCLILSGSEASALLHWFFSPSGALSAVVLLYFWARNIAQFRPRVVWDLILCIIFLLTAGFAGFLFGS